MYSLLYGERIHGKIYHKLTTRLPFGNLWVRKSRARQGEREFTPLARVAFYGDLAAMAADKGLNQAEPQTIAGRGTAAIGPIETLKDVRKVLGVYAHTGIGNTDDHMRKGSFHKQEDVPTARGELDGIIQEVRDYALET